MISCDRHLDRDCYTTMLVKSRLQEFACALVATWMQHLYHPCMLQQGRNCIRNIEGGYAGVLNFQDRQWLQKDVMVVISFSITAFWEMQHTILAEQNGVWS